ncbi:MAG: hypothetical protein ACYDGS_08165 [Thermoleophilia bacterium]
MRRPPATTTRLLIIITAVLLLVTLALTAGGCGKSGISRSQYDQIQKGMTLDQVEGILGQPDRTHRLGANANPNVIWNYNKSEGEGLVRISFLDGKMDVASPYEVSVNPNE